MRVCTYVPFSLSTMTLDWSDWLNEVFPLNQTMVVTGPPLEMQVSAFAEPLKVNFPVIRLPV